MIRGDGLCQLDSTVPVWPRLAGQSLVQILELMLEVRAVLVAMIDLEQLDHDVNPARLVGKNIAQHLLGLVVAAVGKEYICLLQRILTALLIVEAGWRELVEDVLAGRVTRFERWSRLGFGGCHLRRVLCRPGDGLRGGHDRLCIFLGLFIVLAARGTTLGNDDTDQRQDDDRGTAEQPRILQQPGLWSRRRRGRCRGGLFVMIRLGRGMPVVALAFRLGRTLVMACGLCSLVPCSLVLCGLCSLCGLVLCGLCSLCGLVLCGLCSLCGLGDLGGLVTMSLGNRGFHRLCGHGALCLIALTSCRHALTGLFALFQVLLQRCHLINVELDQLLQSDDLLLEIEDLVTELIVLQTASLRLLIGQVELTPEFGQFTITDDGSGTLGRLACLSLGLLLGNHQLQARLFGGCRRRAFGRGLGARCRGRLGRRLATVGVPLGGLGARVGLGLFGSQRRHLVLAWHPQHHTGLEQVDVVADEGVRVRFLQGQHHLGDGQAGIRAHRLGDHPEGLTTGDRTVFTA